MAARHQYQDAYENALLEFASRKPSMMADLAGVQLTGTEMEFKYLERKLRLEWPNGRIWATSGENVAIEDRIIILQYLSQACGVQPRGKWLSFLELPGGPHHYAPFQKEALEPLARTFGTDSSSLERFRKISAALRGRPLDKGDAGAVITALPKIPLAVVLWIADEEFPARATILFDETASFHLPTASLYMLGIQLSRRMCTLKSTDV